MTHTKFVYFLLAWINFMLIMTLLSTIPTCTPPPAQASQAEKAEALIREEIKKNSMGVIQGESIELELTPENDTTYRADYRFLVPNTKDRWRTVNMRYVFDEAITEIKHKERL